MKKLLLSICACLNLQNFPFIPLQGPYYIKDCKKIKQTIYEAANDFYYPTQYFLLYPSNSIAIILKLPKLPFDVNQLTNLTQRYYQKKNLKKELEKNNIFNFSNKKSCIDFIEQKRRNIIFQRNQILQFLKGEFIFDDIQTVLNNAFIDSALTFNPNTYITSLSNIIIENKNQQITLSQNGKEIELIEALKKYYSIPSQVYTDFVHALPKLNEGSSKELLPKLYNYTYYSTIQDRLNESKILAVWNLIPIQIIDHKSNKQTIQSQIFGLAEDKNGKLFHWIADLKQQDISKLMQYAK